MVESVSNKHIKKILIIGYGSSGKRYEKIINKYYKNIILKIFSRQDYRSKRFIKKIEEIKNFDPNLTIFSNPSTKRLKLFKILKNTKTNILFEKPLTGNFSQSKLIKDNKKKIYKVGYNLKQHRILQKFKSILDSKKFGNIIYFSIHVSQYLPNWRNADYERTVSSKKTLGGGVLLELSHEIDYAIYLFGNMKLTKSIFTNTNTLNINTEDVCKIIFQTQKNIIGSIHMDFVSKLTRRFCEVATDKGNLKLDFIKNKIYFSSDNKRKVVFQSKEKISKTYKNQLDQMIDIIDKKINKNNLTDLKSAKYILKIIEKIKNE